MALNAFVDAVIPPEDYRQVEQCGSALVYYRIKMRICVQQIDI